MYITVPGSPVAQSILVIVIDCLLPTLLGFSLEVLSHAAMTHIFLFLISTTFKGCELAKKGGTIKPPLPHPVNTDYVQDQGLFKMTREAIVLLNPLYTWT